MRTAIVLASFIITFAVMVVFSFQALHFSYASSNTALTANVNVGNVIYLSVTNSTGGNVINFGSIFPGTSYNTNVPVTDTDSGGNIGANILVEGTSWALTSNTAVTFSVGNTLWNPTSLTSYAGNALTTTFADTNEIVTAPSLSTPATNSIIYFGLGVPSGTTPGNYIQTISFENYNASQSTYNSISTANAIIAKVYVQGTCYISLTPNTISFGSIVASADVPTNVLVTDSDSGGNVAASLLVSGTDWYLNGNTLATSFGVSNTLYDSAIQTTYTGSALSNTLAVTGITIPAPTASNTVTSNDIYFGLGIPGGTPAGTYKQTITIENSC